MLEEAIGMQLGTIADERKLWPPDPIVAEPDFEDGTSYGIVVTRNGKTLEIEAFNVTPRDLIPLARDLSGEVHPDVRRATDKFVRDLGTEGAMAELAQIVFDHYLKAPLHTVNAFGQRALMHDVALTNGIVTGSLRRTLQSRLVCANAIRQGYEFKPTLPDGNSYAIRPYAAGTGVGYAVFRTFPVGESIRLDTVTPDDLRDPQLQTVYEQYVRGFLNFALLPQMVEGIYQEMSALPVALSAREQRILLERDVRAVARRTEKILRDALPRDLAKRKHWPGDLVVTVPTPPDCSYRLTVGLDNQKVSSKVEFVDSEGHAQRVDKILAPEINTPEGQFLYARFVNDFGRDGIGQLVADAVLTGFFQHVSQEPLDQHENLASDMRRTHDLVRDAVRNVIPRNQRDEQRVNDVDFAVTLWGREYKVQAVKGGRFDFQITRAGDGAKWIDVTRIPKGSMSPTRQRMYEEFVADFSHHDLRRFVADRAREAFRTVRDEVKQTGAASRLASPNTSIFNGQPFEVAGRRFRIALRADRGAAARSTLSA